MPMHAESLEVLEKASVAPAQARAIVRAIEIEISGAKDTLATKHDVLAFRHDLEAVRGDVRQLAGELRGEMTALAAELRGEMAALAAELRAEMAKLGADLRGELRAEIHEAVSGSTRQRYLALLGHMTVTLGFVYFLFAQLR
jgi:hypothetical protein